MMSAAFIAPSFGAVLLQRILTMLETVFHLGVHRCATTSFQAYLDQNTKVLHQAGVAAWTPHHARGALFDGLVRPVDDNGTRALRKQVAAHDRIAAARDALVADGTRMLLVSEENMIGTPRDNLTRGALYPDLKTRLARFVDGFDGRVNKIGLCIRSYEHYWASVLAFAVASGADVPDSAARARLAHQKRSWADLVSDIADVAPHAKIDVWTFEAFAGRPRRQFNMLTGRIDVAGMLNHAPHWKNVSRNCNRLRHILRIKGRADMAEMLPRGAGNWMPFDDAQCAQMRSQYDADKAWLRQPGNPNITFTETTAIKVPRKNAGHLTGPDPNGGHHEPQATLV